MIKKEGKKNQNRTIFIDFQTRERYDQLCQNGKLFVEFVTAFILSLGFSLRHKKGCSGRKGLTRHSCYYRIRLGNLVIWRIQCKECGVVFTVLPHFVLRYLSISVEDAKKALQATHGGLSLENCHIIFKITGMSIFRLVCSLGRQELVASLAKCKLMPPSYFLADEKHSHCLENKVYLPTIVTGRIIWHLGYTQSKDTDDFVKSYGQFKEAAKKIDPKYKPKGALTDGFESTRKSLKKVFPKIILGNCLLHAMKKVPAKLQKTTTEVRELLVKKFYQIFYQAQKVTINPIFEAGQKLRHFVTSVKKLTNADNAKYIQQWIKEKKEGWYILLQDKKMPRTSTYLDQAHNYIDRKLFNMKGFHHPSGHQKEFITGLALLYNVIPFQRRAKNSNLCAIEVDGGKVPTKDWFLNLRLITSGGFS